MSLKKLCNREGQPIIAQNAKYKRRFGLFVVLFFALFYTPFPALAVEPLVQQPVFFEALYDVPVMAGLQELKNEALVFDKPDGKIAFAAAVSKTVTKEQIDQFYAQTLPQMGWKKINYNQYVRDNETLVIEVKSKIRSTIVQFTLRPVQ